MTHIISFGDPSQKCFSVLLLVNLLNRHKFETKRCFTARCARLSFLVPFTALPLLGFPFINNKSILRTLLPR
jgi:hypothetical protein